MSSRTLTPRERAEHVLEQFGGGSWNAHVKAAMISTIEHEIAGALSQRPTELPVVMLTADVAAAMGVAPRTAQRHITEGRCGKFSAIGGVLRIRRSEFLRALEAQERDGTIK